MCSVKMAWEREDWAFMLVLPTLRERAPRLRQSSVWWGGEKRRGEKGEGEGRGGKGGRRGGEERGRGEEKRRGGEERGRGERRRGGEEGRGEGERREEKERGSIGENRRGRGEGQTISHMDTYVQTCTYLLFRLNPMLRCPGNIHIPSWFLVDAQLLALCNAEL